MCKEVQVGQEQLGARVVKKSAKHAGSKSDFKSFFLIDGKLMSRLRHLITPDVIVYEGGSGSEKTSVERKEAAVSGGGARQWRQPTHLGHHCHLHVAHRECCLKGQEQYQKPNLKLVFRSKINFRSGCLIQMSKRVILPRS